MGKHPEWFEVRGRIDAMGLGWVTNGAVAVVCDDAPGPDLPDAGTPLTEFVAVPSRRDEQGHVFLGDIPYDAALVDLVEAMHPGVVWMRGQEGTAVAVRPAGVLMRLRYDVADAAERLPPLMEETLTAIGEGLAALAPLHEAA